MFCLSQIFPYMYKIQGHSGKLLSEKTRVFAYFTQCDVFHLLAQKLRHHSAKIIDMILKITNCQEIFS